MLFSSSSTPKTKVQREFRFVPYGESFTPTANDNRPTISCDGRIPGGVTLELTHWTGNATPDRWYADTSTEMALKLAAATAAAAADNDDDNSSIYPNALVLNNHYDTDGVLSVWACLHPDKALEYQTLLRQGAEAGDFGEWPSDDGVKLNWIVENYCNSKNEEQAYEDILPQLEDILKDVTQNDGKGYKELWQADMEAACKSWDEFRKGKNTLTRGPGKIVLVQQESSSSTTMDPHALHKALLHTNLWSDTTRILRFDNKKLLFSYSKIGHGWVQRLVTRPVVPPADATAIVDAMNAACGDGVWKAGGAGLTAICYSTASQEWSPQQVMQLLYEADAGAQ